MRVFVAALKIALFVLLSLLVVPVQMIVMLFTKGPGAYIVPYFWQCSLKYIFRIRVHVVGKPVQDKQIIFVANHLSYLDVPALGSILKASFVARGDAASWPVFGFLCRLQQTAFISRSREDARRATGTLETMISEKKSLIIFPEGTSTDGSGVLPFKSSLFSLFFQEKLKGLFIQPVTIKLVQVNGHDLHTQADRDLYAWHEGTDISLPAHLWRFAQSNGAVVRIYFHDVVTVNSLFDRKTLAKHCHETVSNGLRIEAA